MFRDMSPSAIAAELGMRLKRARLNQNISQKELANQAWVTRKAVLNAEKGQVSLEVFVAIMNALNLLDQLDLFLPEQLISPLQLAKLLGKRRERASPSSAIKDNNEDEFSW